MRADNEKQKKEQSALEEMLPVQKRETGGGEKGKQYPYKGEVKWVWVYGLGEGVDLARLAFYIYCSQGIYIVDSLEKY